MPRSQNRPRARRVIAGAAAAGGVLAAALLVSMASASAFTLRVEKNVHVTNGPTKALRVKAVDAHEAVAVGPSGFAVYTFQGETTRHLICRRTSNAKTNCWAFWPPVSVRSSRGLSPQKGINGRLGSFTNHGTRQLTLNGQPLYYFTPDLQSGNKRQATGDELKTFGSVWHIVPVGSAVQPGATSSQPTPTTTPTTTTTTTSNPPPSYPGY